MSSGPPGPRTDRFLGLRVSHGTGMTLVTSAVFADWSRVVLDAVGRGRLGGHDQPALDAAVVGLDGVQLAVLGTTVALVPGSPRPGTGTSGPPRLPPTPLRPSRREVVRGVDR